MVIDLLFFECEESQFFDIRAILEKVFSDIGPVHKRLVDGMLLVGDELDKLFQLQTSFCDLSIESVGVGWQSITIGVESVSNSLKFRGYYAVISSLIHDHEN